MAKTLLRGFHTRASELGRTTFFEKAARAQGMSFVYFEVCAGNVPAGVDVQRYGQDFAGAGFKVGPYHRFSKEVSGKEQAKAFVKRMVSGAYPLLENGYTLRPAIYVADGTMPNLADHLYDWIKEVTLSLYASNDKALHPILMASERTIEVGKLTPEFKDMMALWLQGGNADSLRSAGWEIPIWLRELDFPIASELLPFDLATDLGPSRFELFPKVGIEGAPFLAGAATVGGAWYVKNVIFKRRGSP